MFSILFHVGRIFGMSFLSISGLFGKEQIFIIGCSLCGTFFVTLSILTLIYYSNIRIKAISRILRKLTASNKNRLG